MTHKMEHRGRRILISGIRPRAVSAALAFAALLVSVVVATPSAAAQTYKVLYNFAGGTDGAYPYAALLLDSAGNLEGTTYLGGAFGSGTVFKVDTTGTETVLYSFQGGTDGANPEASVIADATGNLYGTTSAGGASDKGTVFKLDPTGTETVLHTFTFPPDGEDPQSGLLLDAQGNLYGTTLTGGSAGFGTVFWLAPNGTEKILHAFTDVLDAGTPHFAGLIQDTRGNFYGTTQYGGCRLEGEICGTVFKLNTFHKENVLHRFSGASDGHFPFASLLMDSAGNFYGTTELGGTHCKGTVFKLSASGKETILYNFTGGTDGGLPVSSLVMDAAGNLYGTTYAGGTSNLGTIFELSATGTETVLHSFNGNDGAQPLAGVTRDAAGNLYGPTSLGGSSTTCSGGCGVVFELTP
ncbi:MAG TPA: choice-of-anchor tandem repeat GloVer-containing protein [Terriglobia bacterium]|nr:choice-of-anchor tandem repeat GloVer-containing protein [Terriglobia bacterium]